MARKEDKQPQYLPLVVKARLHTGGRDYEKIKEEYNGYNAPQLSRRYGVTERWIRQICGNDFPGQVELLDYLAELENSRK